MHITQNISSVFSRDITVCVKSMKRRFGTWEPHQHLFEGRSMQRL
jgi:hypothetical protein